MTINEAITWLEAAKKAQANDGSAEVYFDCPKCKVTFDPVKLHMRIGS